MDVPVVQRRGYVVCGMSFVISCFGEDVFDNEVGREWGFMVVGKRAGVQVGS